MKEGRGKSNYSTNRRSFLKKASWQQEQQPQAPGSSQPGFRLSATNQKKKSGRLTPGDASILRFWLLPKFSKPICGNSTMSRRNPR